MSDPEFESALCKFERRFDRFTHSANANGSDAMFRQMQDQLESAKKHAKDGQSRNKTLQESVLHWKASVGERDSRIQDLEDTVSLLLKERTELEQAVVSRQDEIANTVVEARAELEKAEAEKAPETGLATADAGEPAEQPTLVTQELVKIRDSYAASWSQRQAEKQEMQESRPAAEMASPGVAAKPEADRRRSLQLLRQVEQRLKTGEMAQLEVYGLGDLIELRAQEKGGEDRLSQELAPALVKELMEADPQDPWTQLFARTGLSAGPDKRLLIATCVGQKEARLPHNDVPVLLSVFRYDSRRFGFSALELTSQLFVDCFATEADIAPALGALLDECGSDGQLFDLLASRLSLSDDKAAGSRLLVFDGA